MISIPIWLFVLFICFSVLGLILFAAIIYGVFACIFTPVYIPQEPGEDYGTEENK